MWLFAVTSCTEIQILWPDPYHSKLNYSQLALQTRSFLEPVIPLPTCPVCSDHIDKLTHLPSHCHCFLPASWHSEPGLQDKWSNLPHHILQSHFFLATILNYLIIVLNPGGRNCYFPILYQFSSSSSTTECWFCWEWNITGKENCSF